MDIVISAVASELVSRLISFLSSQYSSHACVKQNLEALRRVLLRADTIVEEAEGRYLSNSAMLAQLRTLTAATFRGHDVLDACTPLEKLRETEEASGLANRSGALLSLIRPLNKHHQVVESTVRDLETTVASMAEFVVLLTGCQRRQRMSRSPYSSYLYMDNFMFGRQVERQQAITVLTTKDDDDDDHRRITVLPIIGGCRVGKKTLVASVCRDDRIRSCYPRILHFTGDEITQRIDGGEKQFSSHVRTLVTVEFAADVADEAWRKFRSLLAASTGPGSKVIIISRVEKLARFGTVSPPVRVGRLSREEYGYLFKVLAFGSADPADHPRLALLGRELAALFRGSLVMLNVYAAVLRASLSVRLWTRVLELFRAMARTNLDVFGEHPTALLERDGGAVDITGFSLSSLSGASFRLVLLPTVAAKGAAAAAEDGGGGAVVLPTMSFGDIIAGAEVLPDRFRLVWESRLPPYTVVSADCAAEKQQLVSAVSPRRNKRQRLCMSP